MKEKGYNVLRFWEKEFTKEAVEKEIQNIINKHELKNEAADMLEEELKVPLKRRIKMDNISDRIKELEQNEKKFLLMKSFVNDEVLKIQGCLKQIEESLIKLNPVLDAKLTKHTPKVKTSKRVAEIVNYLKENDGVEIDTDKIAQILNISYNTASKVAVDLRKEQGILSRNDNRRIFMYYFKPKVDSNGAQITPEFAMPNKFSFMGGA
jgi:signal transduction histidine kinase